MKKNYTKPLFMKTLYISIDMMANTTEEISPMFGIQSMTTSTNHYGESDTRINVIGDLENCSCEECPDGSLFCASQCSDTNGKC